MGSALLSHGEDGTHDALVTKHTALMSEPPSPPMCELMGSFAHLPHAAPPNHTSAHSRPSEGQCRGNLGLPLFLVLRWKAVSPP